MGAVGFAETAMAASRIAYREKKGNVWVTPKTSAWFFVAAGGPATVLQPRYVVMIELAGGNANGHANEHAHENAGGREEAEPSGESAAQPVQIVPEDTVACFSASQSPSALNGKTLVTGPFPLWVAEEVAAVAKRLVSARNGVLALVARATGAPWVARADWVDRPVRQGLKWLAEMAANVWLRRRLRREVGKRMADSAGYTWQGQVPGSSSAEKPPDDETLMLVKTACDGRALMLKELVSAVEIRSGGSGPPAGEVAAAAEELVRRGELRRVAAVGAGPRLTCRRCGGSNITVGPCWQCGSLDCPMCQDCKALGQARGCQPLYAGRPSARTGRAENVMRATPGVVVPVAAPSVHLPPGVSLTPAQKEASTTLSEWCATGAFPDEDGSSKIAECLVWAVCGAGKTEILLDAIAEEIGRGGRVLYATPRREVTLEVGARLAAALPAVGVSVAAGGLPGRIGPVGQLVVATAPQAVRFYRVFTLAAVDEVDAFPYPSDPMLDRAIRRALVQGGRLVYLTATPHPRLLARVERGDMPAIRLLARHHGQKLPEPEVIQVGRRSGGSSPLCADEGKVLARLLRSWQGAQGAQGTQGAQETLEARAFVFVPTVSRVAEVARALRSAGIACEGCCAADPERPSKIMAFRDGNTKVLVTTTVLERGVTVSGVNVVVWGADSELFSASQLIQMAGRAGRTSEAPTGRVVFAVIEETPQVKRACRDIRDANRMARESGYISAEAEAV